MINPKLFDATGKFVADLEKDEFYQEAVELVRQNSHGKIWMIGGGVYRPIISHLYGEIPESLDYDFIVENPGEPPHKLPPHWAAGTNRHGNPKFVLGDNRIDFVPLKNIHSIIARGLEPTMENYLTGTPLNIQSICYDLQSQKVLGDIGLRAILRRIVAVNNLQEAQHCARNKRMTVEDYVKKYASELGFSASL